MLLAAAEACPLAWRRGVRGAGVWALISGGSKGTITLQVHTKGRDAPLTAPSSTRRGRPSAPAGSGGRHDLRTLPLIWLDVATVATMVIARGPGSCSVPDHGSEPCAAQPPRPRYASPS